MSPFVLDSKRVGMFEHADRLWCVAIEMNAKKQRDERSAAMLGSRVHER